MVYGTAGGAGFAGVFAASLRDSAAVAAGFRCADAVDVFVVLRELCVAVCTQGVRVPHAVFAGFVFTRDSGCAAAVL